MLDIRELIERIEATVQNHNLGRPGAYARWRGQNPHGHRDLGVNEYGCADAANIFYTIGRFPRDAAERAGWIEVLQGLQDTATGAFREMTHHEFHTTAHCIAALELFDAGPRHRLTHMEPLLARPALEAFLNGLDWLHQPWSESHRGAGLFAALVLAGEADSGWQDWYFDWLWQEADPQTGLWRKDHVGVADARGVFPHVAGSFHYLFNHEYARRPLRYPDKMVDFCLALYRDKGYPSLGRTVGFAEIDWVFCLTRSVRQSGHRFDESRDALHQFATDYIGFLQELDAATHDGWNDLHALFGATCALAELQQAVPGFIRTEQPLKLVLDRRPFI